MRVAVRDPRMWGVIAVAIGVRFGLDWMWDRERERMLAGREAPPSVLSMEVGGPGLRDEVEAAHAERARAEARAREAIARANAEDLGAPAPGLAPGMTVGADGAVRRTTIYTGDQGGAPTALPAWAITGGVGLLIAGLASVAALLFLRTGDEREAEDRA